MDTEKVVPDMAEEPSEEAASSEVIPPVKAKREKKPKHDFAADIEVLETQLAEAEEQQQRLRAEYANYMRRTAAEKENLGSFVKGETLKALLPALDSLERAGDSANTADAGALRTGIENTLRQLTEVLAALGLTAVGEPGDHFNPELHNAVMREDAPDGVDPDTVTEVYQKGYLVDGRIVRPAMVKVVN